MSQPVSYWHQTATLSPECNHKSPLLIDSTGPKEEAISQHIVHHWMVSSISLGLDHTARDSALDLSPKAGRVGERVSISPTTSLGRYASSFRAHISPVESCFR